MAQRHQATATIPAQPFFATPQQRLALARERYFEDGVRPSGLVGESIIQSWSRCLQAHRDPCEALAFNPVTASRVQSALARSRLLLETAAGELDQLHRTLAGTACTVILTDPQGVVVHSTWTGESADERLLPLARRVGVCLDEESGGTNAPGLTARSGQLFPPMYRTQAAGFGTQVNRLSAVHWWEELTAGGGEGAVCKPLEFVAQGKRGLLQPAIKVRGREYLRIIYGPEYTLPEHLERLRSRGLGAKRSLALREFALGIEGLERFVRREPLRRTHEAVFAVLALESEPVDSRL